MGIVLAIVDIRRIDAVNDIIFRSQECFQIVSSIVDTHRPIMIRIWNTAAIEEVLCLVSIDRMESTQSLISLTQREIDISAVGRCIVDTIIVIVVFITLEHLDNLIFD